MGVGSPAKRRYWVKTVPATGSLGPMTGALADTGPDQPSTIRDAVPGDCPVLVGLVKDLARYEKAEGSVEMTEADLASALFVPQPRVFCLVAEVDGSVAGMALYFFTFSTWTGKPGLFLEDLFVLPEQRRRGVGRALLSALAARAVAAGCGRVNGPS